MGWRQLCGKSRENCFVFVFFMPQAGKGASGNSRIAAHKRQFSRKLCFFFVFALQARKGASGNSRIAVRERQFWWKFSRKLCFLASCVSGPERVERQF